MRSLRLAFALVFLCTCACAQYGDVGEVYLANSGAAAAQASFEHGLAELHDFEYGAAVKDFHQAEALDPNFAMAYWAEALTHVHLLWDYDDLAGGRAALNKLAPTAEARAAKAPTQREKDYLSAIESLYGAGTRAQRWAKYARAMGDLHRTYPDDVDAAAFYAVGLMGTVAQHRDYAIYMRAATVLEDYFPRYPRHPGVLHYLIHAYDDPVHAPLGMRAARFYAAVAPNAAHAQHMVSHIFIALGMWPEVVAANEKSVAVSQRTTPNFHCGHAITWLEYGYLQQGRFDDASRILAACKQQAIASAAHGDGDLALDPDHYSWGSYSNMRAQYIFATERWNDPELAAPAPPAQLPAAQLTFAYANGIAAAKRGDVAAARQALSIVQAARKNMETTLSAEHSNDDAYRPRAAVIEQQLAAMVTFAAGHPAQAVAALRQAAADESRVPFEFGPPFIEKPSEELIGEVMLAAKDPGGAKAAFEEVLKRAPGRTLALRSLRIAAANTGDEETATRAAAQLERNLSPSAHAESTAALRLQR